MYYQLHPSHKFSHFNGKEKNCALSVFLNIQLYYMTKIIKKKIERKSNNNEIKLMLHNNKNQYILAVAHKRMKSHSKTSLR